MPYGPRMAPAARLPRALLAAAVTAAIAPVGAAAAAIQVDRACYLESDRAKVTLSGSGFSPGGAYQVLLDGRVLGGGTADETGLVTGTFAAPALPGARRERRYGLEVVEGANSARTAFSVSSFLADFAPARGDPRRLKVRFSGFGFGLVQKDPLAPVAPALFVHYVPPHRRGTVRTRRIARTSGPCGRLRATSLRRLFPFPPRTGLWTLQFDTNRRYRRGARGADFLFFSIAVRVRPRR